MNEIAHLVAARSGPYHTWLREGAERWAKAWRQHGRATPHLQPSPNEKAGLRPVDRIKYGPQAAIATCPTAGELFGIGEDLSVGI